MNTTRNVIVVDGSARVITDEGTFLCWGTMTDYAGTDCGTSAIIGMPDGTVKNIPLDLVKFKMEGHREWQALIK